MNATPRRIDVDPERGGTPSRREPSTAVRRKPSLYLVRSLNTRLTTDAYAGQGRPNAASAGRAGAADANSNVASQTHPTESRTYVYDTEDRLKEDRATAGSGTTNLLAYDLNGNRTQQNTTAYLYTASTNRLTQIGTKVQTRPGGQHSPRTTSTSTTSTTPTAPSKRLAPAPPSRAPIPTTMFATMFGGQCKNSSAEERVLR